jgi:hypothetical protein
MAHAAAGSPSIPDERLGELIDLIGGADSVELKLTVPETEHYATAGSLGLDPIEAQIRQVYFFDTPELAMNRAGVVVRGRRVQQRSGDCIVKLRPALPSELPKKLRKSNGFSVEVDAMPGGFVCSATLKRPVENAEVRAVALEGAPLSGLLSPGQLEFLSERAPEGCEIDDLVPLGPVLVLKLKFEPRGYDRRLVAEVWLYPDSSRVLELSTKCAPSDAFLVAAQTRAFLSERGVNLSAEQQTKTMKALAFFSKRAVAA